MVPAFAGMTKLTGITGVMLLKVGRVDSPSGNPPKLLSSIGSEEAEASVCPQNRAYGSVHGSSRKTDPLRNFKPVR